MGENKLDGKLWHAHPKTKQQVVPLFVHCRLCACLPGDMRPKSSPSQRKTESTAVRGPKSNFTQDEDADLVK
eukprot:scaffold281331_cov27-Prasinocladus_malaysianus.AAC.1